MKIKLDENLPFRLANPLQELGHEVHTTYEEGLAGHGDQEIWDVAQRETRFLITQDLDFSDLRQFAPGTHSGILLVRLRSPDRRSLIERIENLFRTEMTHDWNGCFVVATDRKVRVLKPLNK